jgi:predicted ArsR family transcriptional regulator
LKNLIAADYVTTRKETGSGRPQSFYALTPTELNVLCGYVKALQSMLPRDKQQSNSKQLVLLRTT